MKKKILVVDIGGSHVKLLMSPRNQRKFDSGSSLKPREFVARIRANVDGWSFNAVSIGFPAPVRDGQVVKGPKHLGKNWVGFDFSKALGKPTQVINDAAMQALGSYHGGRMLFLGLGTGLGSALVWRKNLLSLELGDLPYREGAIIEEWLGQPGLEELGQKKWMREVTYAVKQLKRSFIADYVVLGGGNARFFKHLPAGVERGDNRNAFRGGVRLWESDPRTRRKKWRIM
ncbi:MAG: ROK family protein [Verrucomicrobiota bacterium]|nr:ROK family protein [Verrucomicrobiota bacterium]